MTLTASEVAELVDIIILPEHLHNSLYTTVLCLNHSLIWGVLVGMCMCIYLILDKLVTRVKLELLGEGNLNPFHSYQYDASTSNRCPEPGEGSQVNRKAPGVQQK